MRILLATPLVLFALLGADAGSRTAPAGPSTGSKGSAASLPGAGSASAGGTISGRVIVVDNGKPVVRDDVFAYLEQLPVRRHAPPGAGLLREIRQVDQQFTPHVVVVPVGATVAFPNYDRQEHNVFSPTDPPGQFDLGRYNTDRKGKPHTFDDPGEMDIFCDIHKEMWAKVKVVDSAMIVPIKNARFTFEHVPPGTYRVVAWAPDSTEVSEKVVVTEGKTTQLQGDLHVQLGKQKPHLRKDGRPYCPRGYDC